MDITRNRALAVAVATLAIGTLTACRKIADLRPLERLNLRGNTSAADSVSRAQTGDQAAQDVEAPDVFAAEDAALWDGRPSLGGVWVAHADVEEPERVRIRNAETGAVVTGALFRREQELPGPPLQVSSDAATALGMVAGAPVKLEVVALRREEAPAETIEPPAAPAVTELADATATARPTVVEPVTPAGIDPVVPAGIDPASGWEIPSGSVALGTAAAPRVQVGLLTPQNDGG